MKTVKVGFLGCGNIGCGVYRLLGEQAQAIGAQEGLRFDVRRILVRDKTRRRAADIPQALLTERAEDVVDSPEIGIVLEFMGGVQPAAEYMIRALRSGKTVVTANKMALASRWSDILAAAWEGGAGLLFEASVGGAIPVVRALGDSLQANRITSIMGIINGTTNYILTRMAAEGLSYGTALEEAQRLGLAEPDPTADVEGYDAVYKLSILSSLAFHRHVPPEAVYREGITKITPLDIRYARQFGLTLRLLAVARRTDDEVQVRVHPAFVPDDHPLASVNGAFNAIFVRGHACGDMMLYGRGAGDMPTASAVVSDLICAGRGGIRLPAVDGEETRIAADWMSEYFIRLQARDEPGVLAMVAGRMAEQGVSIASVVQTTEPAERGRAQVVLLTHSASERAVRKALDALDPAVVTGVSFIRVEGRAD